MSIDHIISAFVAGCFALTSTILLCFKVEISTGCDILPELGNEMVEPPGFGRRSQCLALFACNSKAFTPWPGTDTVFEQTQHLAQCTFPLIFCNQVLNSLFASQSSWKEVLYLILLLIQKYKSQNLRRYYLKNINYYRQK